MKLSVITQTLYEHREDTPMKRDPVIGDYFKLKENKRTSDWIEGNSRNVLLLIEEGGVDFSLPSSSLRIVHTRVSSEKLHLTQSKSKSKSKSYKIQPKLERARSFHSKYHLSSISDVQFSSV